MEGKTALAQYDMRKTLASASAVAVAVAVAVTTQTTANSHAMPPPRRQ